MSLIPNTAQATYMTERQIKRKHKHQINKLEKKYGKSLPMPTEDDIGQYIANKTQTEFQWQTSQEESQTN